MNLCERNSFLFRACSRRSSRQTVTDPFATGELGNTPDPRAGVTGYSIYPPARRYAGVFCLRLAEGHSGLITPTDPARWNLFIVKTVEDARLKPVLDSPPMMLAMQQTEMKDVNAADAPAAPLTEFHPEETVNAITHGIGVLGGLLAAAFLVATAARHGGPWQLIGCALYGVTMVAAYVLSTLSHVVRKPHLREAFRIADQAAIFLFMAGTYTPVALTWLRTGPWWALHVTVWSIAMAGFLSKAVFTHRVTLGTVSTLLYVLLGWLPALFVWPMIGIVPGRLMLWYLAGGLCYMAGTVFFRYDHRVRYFHALWHVWVIAGTGCQYIGILHYCTGAR